MSLQIGLVCMYMWYFVMNYKENWKAVLEWHFKVYEGWTGSINSGCMEGKETGVYY